MYGVICNCLNIEILFCNSILIDIVLLISPKFYSSDNQYGLHSDSTQVIDDP